MIILRYKRLLAYINKFSAKLVMPILLVVTVLIISILSGCAGGNENQQKQQTRQKQRKQQTRPTKQSKRLNEATMDGVSIKLKIDPKAAPDAVDLSLNIKNNSKKPIKAMYPSAKKFDFMVKNSAGEEIWHWSRGQMFAQMLAEETLAPGNSLKFSAKWPKTNDAGDAVKPGKYIIYGWWLGQGFNKKVKASVEI